MENQIQKNKKSWAENVKMTDLDYFDFEKLLMKEMSAYESNKVRGKFLSITYNYLMTKSPTSVEAKQAFSAAAYIRIRLRSRLSDDTISRVCLLKAHFLQ